MRHAILALSLLLAAAPPALAAPTLASGLYGALVLSVKGGEVSGAYSEQRVGNGTDAAPQFSCVFLLKGSVSGGGAEVATWYPGDTAAIHGRLTASADGVRLALKQDQGGCAMTSGGMVDPPFEAVRDKPGAGWIGAALVASRRAPLRPAPGAAPPARPYLVKGDAVAVLERRAGWVRISYPLADKPLSGWVAEHDLAPSTAPGR